MSDFPASMLIFGCGNMGGAMLRGWIAGGVDPARFTVIDPVADNLPDGVRLLRSATAASGQFEAVLLGIKPQLLAELAPAIAPLLAPYATLVSILAGTTSATLANHFTESRIVRLMPNLAAAIGKSPLGLWSAEGDPGFRSGIDHWFSPLGQPLWLDSEAQMDAVTALAGSGPAFVYRYIDALAAGGAALGLSPELSGKLALAMVEGAALLAAQSEEGPAALAKRVTSPGGTTAAGLGVLDKDNALAQLVQATLRAAAMRGAELAKGA